MGQKTKKRARAREAVVTTKEKVEMRKAIKKKVKWEFPLLRQNYLILAVGLLVILTGFALMSTGITEEPAVPDGTWNNPMAINVAPALLVIGYCVIIPFAILKYFGKKDS